VSLTKDDPGGWWSFRSLHAEQKMLTRHHRAHSPSLVGSSDVARAVEVEDTITNTAFPCLFLTKPHLCLFILLMSKIGQKARIINKQGYGWDRKGIWKRGKREGALKSTKILLNRINFLWAIKLERLVAVLL